MSEQCKVRPINNGEIISISQLLGMISYFKDEYGREPDGIYVTQRQLQSLQNENNTAPNFDKEMFKHFIKFCGVELVVIDHV